MIEEKSPADRFFDHAANVIAELRDENLAVIQEAAEAAAVGLTSGGGIHTFGAGHSGLVAQDVYYRAGGLEELQAVFDPHLTLDFQPVAETSAHEKTEGLIVPTIAELDLDARDTLIVISTSGVNAAGVDAALIAKEKGALLIAISGRDYASRLAPRHSSGETLMSLADHLLENRSPYGDTVLEVVPGGPRMGSTSTLAGVALLQALICEIWRAAAMRGERLPVYKSGNLPPEAT